MATKQLSNKFRYEQGLGNIDWANDEFRVILMDDAFVFDPNTHGTYADVSANEMSALNGYSQLSKVLSASTAWTRDDANNRAYLAWSNPLWTASGGDLGGGAIGAALFLQYDSGTPDNSVVVGCATFDSAVTVSDGVDFQLLDTGFELA